MATDLLFTVAGDIELSANGDLKLVSGADQVAQGIIFRLKTVAGDFVLQPGCGASLESLIGEANSAETGRTMEALIVNSLTHDGFLREVDLTVTVFPTSTTTISALVVVVVDDRPVRVAASVDLVEGRVDTSLV